MPKAGRVTVASLGDRNRDFDVTLSVPNKKDSVMIVVFESHQVTNIDQANSLKNGASP